MASAGGRLTEASPIYHRILINPVSYTHLDVYKRQVVSQDRFKQWETEWTGLFTLFVIKTLKIDDSSESYMIKWCFIAVSYTHLDVYKRQVL